MNDIYSINEGYVPRWRAPKRKMQCMCGSLPKRYCGQKHPRGCQNPAMSKAVEDWPKILSPYIGKKAASKYKMARLFLCRDCFTKIRDAIVDMERAKEAEKIQAGVTAARAAYEKLKAKAARTGREVAYIPKSVTVFDKSGKPVKQEIVVLRRLVRPSGKAIPITPVGLVPKKQEPARTPPAEVAAPATVTPTATPPLPEPKPTPLVRADANRPCGYCGSAGVTHKMSGRLLGLKMSRLVCPTCASTLSTLKLPNTDINIERLPEETRGYSWYSLLGLYEHDPSLHDNIYGDVDYIVHELVNGSVRVWDIL